MTPTYDGNTESERQAADRKARITLAAKTGQAWYGRSLAEMIVSTCPTHCPTCGTRLVLDDYETERYICPDCLKTF